jgi:putative ABC transport system permease protein
MWRNYAIVGFRALAKSRTYAFINIAGLSIGLAACLMLLLYVRYERSYDAWLPNAENVYQLQSNMRDPGGGEENNLQMSPYAAGTTLAADFPQIEHRVYALAAAPVVSHNGETLPVEDAIFVDGDLLEVLQLPLLAGDPATALDQVGSLILSKSEAQRFFGNANPLGRTLTLITRGQSVNHRITAVMADLPRNSHQRFSMVARFDPVRYYGEQAEDFLNAWSANAGWNYIALRPGTDPSAINDNMEGWEDRNIPDVAFGDSQLNIGDYGQWRLVNVRDVHLGIAQVGAATPGNDERTILTFTIVAFLILGMACINFTNLATARAGQRAREVALRKVLGANRGQLMTQFLLESALLAAAAMLLALSLVELALPTMSRFLDADLSLNYLGADGMLLPVLVLTLLVGAAGGLYPAFYLSRFQPAQVLKANKSASETAGSGRLRSVLVVSQFAVSIGLIICTAVVYAQTVHARTSDPGYNREGLLQIAGLNRKQLIGSSEAIAREIGRLPGVEGVSRTGISIDPENRLATVVAVPGRAQPVRAETYPIDEHFMRVMQLQTVAGRGLDPNQPMDVEPISWDATAEQERAYAARGLNVVINEKAARDLGYAAPAAAVGGQLRMGLVRPEAGLVPITIVGVVRDTRFRSIREPLQPIIFRLSNLGASRLVVRYNDAEPEALRERIGQVWRRMATDVPYEAEFSEDIVAEQYQGEQARAQIFAGFALLAVIVACLGPVRPCRLHRRAPHQGDRHPQGAGRAHGRHREAARLAIFQARDRRQSDRLADRLVGDARLAEHVRHARRPWRRAFPAGRPARAWNRDRHHRQPCFPGRTGEPDPCTSV